MPKKRRHKKKPNNQKPNNTSFVTAEYCRKFNELGVSDPTAVNALHLMSLEPSTESTGAYYVEEGFIDGKPVKAWNYTEPNASSNINAIKY